MESPYDYIILLQKVIRQGKRIYGIKYNIDKEDEPTFLKLLYWFWEDEQLAAENGIDLKKGILLSGPVGCGKTAIMKILCSFCKPPYRFPIMTCMHIAGQFATQGYPVIHDYTIKSFIRNTTPLTICFDNLGSETNASFYGSTCNTMLQIIAMRYELFMEKEMITHATTSMNSRDLGERYGHHIRSRMREMFNVIAFPANSRDKRT